LILRKPDTKKTPALLIFLCFACCMATASPADTLQRSTARQAIAYLESIGRLDSSSYWPHIDPELLLRNLNYSIRAPLKAFEGKNTNFCAYTALTYVPIRSNPLGFSKFIIDIYKNGRAQMGKAMIEPSLRVREMAGKMKYKGELDINHLAQLWFLSLADHFKGYLNFFNQKFDEGDENRLWAATNFSKFNRMLRRLFGFKVTAKGADLVRPHIPDIYNYLQNGLKRGSVFLYLNNRLLYKKKHEVSRFGIPTHYVVLTDMWREGDKITIIYWDAGRKTLQEVTDDFLKQIVFGVSICTNPANNE
jgi:hypothetical protein